MPTRKKSRGGGAARAAKRASRTAPPRAARTRSGTARPPRRGRKASRAVPRPRAEQPLGVGVGDPYAMKRLNVPMPPPRAKVTKGVREIGWAEFGVMAQELAGRVGREFQPEVVLGVVNGGVFLGGALAAPFKAEFHPVRIEKHGKRSVVPDRLPSLIGKRVLAVDDVTMSGTTLFAVCEAARQAGARETRTATLVVRPSRNHSDFYAMETPDIVVFGWDYQLQGAPDGGPDDPGEVGV